MMNRNILSNLIKTKESRGGGFLLLIDPDKNYDFLTLAESALENGVDAILVGSSFVLGTNFSEAVKGIKERTELPVIIFPGSYAQITPYADAILFTSLISGRNPNYLIGEQVNGAPLVKKSKLEPIPTGYMLIASESHTSVEYISNTQPIPREKIDIACAHALAAQYMGMKTVYLEAGSGAKLKVPEQMIAEVVSYIDIPVIVGGGLRTSEDCAGCIEAGASFVVVGNQMEQSDNSQLKEMAGAVHSKEIVKA